jgi:hypothetical protein
MWCLPVASARFSEANLKPDIAYFLLTSNADISIIYAAVTKRAGHRTFGFAPASTS